MRQVMVVCGAEGGVRQRIDGDVGNRVRLVRYDSEKASDAGGGGGGVADGMVSRWF